jgi:hypothetical protein
VPTCKVNPCKSTVYGGWCRTRGYPDASIEAAHFTGISGLDRRALTALALSSWIDPLLSDDRIKTIKWE